LTTSYSCIGIDSCGGLDYSFANTASDFKVSSSFLSS